jgi:hypothetical protein
VYYYCSKCYQQAVLKLALSFDKDQILQVYVCSETVSSLVSKLTVQILSLVQLTETIKIQQINETIAHKKQLIDITNDITILQQHQKLLQDDIQNLQQQKAEETNNFQQHKTSLTNKLLLLKC